MCTDARSMSSCQKKRVNLEPVTPLQRGEKITDYSLALARSDSGCLKLHGEAPFLWIHSSIIICILEHDVSQWRKCGGASRRVVSPGWRDAPYTARALVYDLAGRAFDRHHLKLCRVSHGLLPHFGRAVACECHHRECRLLWHHGLWWHHGW